MTARQPSKKQLTRYTAKDGRSGVGKKCKLGRPIKSHTVQVVPVFRDEIDVKKLGRAALRLAMQLADTEQELDEARRYGISDEANSNET